MSPTTGAPTTGGPATGGPATGGPARIRDLPRPAPAPTHGLKDTLRTELIDTFELRMRPELWRPGDPTLLRALGGARRILALCDRPEQEHRLDAYLGHCRERGALDRYRTVRLPDLRNSHDLRAAGDHAPVRAVVRAAVEAGLGRRDAFVCLAGASGTAVTALAAAMYRRHVRAVRVHDDLPALLASLHWSARVLAGAPALAAEARDPVLLVDVDTLLADPAPVRPDERSAVRHLAGFDPVLADQLDRGSDPARIRRAALDAVARLLHRYGPGDRRIWRPPPRSRSGTRPAPSTPARPPSSGVPPAPCVPAGSAFPPPLNFAVGLAAARGAPAAREAPRVASAPVPAPVRAHRIRELSYRVTFTTGILDPDNAALSAHLPAGARVLAVVDDYSPAVTAAVRDTLASRCRGGRLAGYTVLPLRSSPRGKTFDAAGRLLRRVHRLGLGPADRILAVGGGTVLDLVGYVAACHPGGTPYLRVPTTLVGLVDAGVGLKVGVDSDGRKNLLGAYHPPLACLCDAGFLETLPDAEFRCGLAEIVKIALVRDARLYALVEEHHAALRDPAAAPVLDEVLRRAVAAMLVELEENPWERRLRRLADFGHEFGHLLEERSGHRLRHGEAVAVGMALSCRLGVAAGRLPQGLADRAETLLRRIGLPTYDGCCDADELWRALHTHVLPQKGGELHLAVPVGIGIGGFVDSIDEIDATQLRRAWSALRRRADPAPRRQRPHSTAPSAPAAHTWSAP
ncbi:3-dehydroquinate synthase family protein [Plantactinospora sp. WMMC1484]|uniref:3-dehydroquinate synthase family protein n=1 Tax=Plantactinospora sp. WMMC1484 TaxID=3404122 RepID=UPI003BF4A810